MKNKNSILGLLICSLILISCKKFVEVDSPVGDYDGRSLYQKDINAIGTITGIYQELSAGGFLQGQLGVAVITGLSVDELKGYSGISELHTAAYQNNLTSEMYPFWDKLYYHIYSVNTAMLGIERSTGLGLPVKQRLLGEAKFLRAYFYFYLVNLWGEIPMPLDNDYTKNRHLSRSSTSKVYEQIVKDLEEAEQLLDERYLLSDLKTESTERIRPNRWVVKAFLSRVFLYIGNYSKAETYASALINHSDFFVIEELSDVFLKSSKESIWQIQSIDLVFNTREAKALYLVGQPNGDQPASLSSNLMDAFEKDDQRQIIWTKTQNFIGQDFSFPTKYRSIQENAEKTEDFVVFRLAEQYLIRSEARAKLGNVTGSQSDLNVIRNRAGLDGTPADNTSDLLQAIEDERRVELFAEAGHRWLDLKRTKRLDPVMTSIIGSKGDAIWNVNKSLFPIPASELLRNRNMTQNTGY